MLSKKKNKDKLNIKNNRHLGWLQPEIKGRIMIVILLGLSLLAAIDFLISNIGNNNSQYTLTSDDLKNPATLKKLIKQLHAPDYNTFARAMNSLDSVGLPAIQLFVEAIKDTGIYRQERAMEALASIHDANAIDEFAKLLCDSNQQVRTSAQIALEETNSADAVPSLIGLLDDTNALVRQSALKALRGVRDIAAFPYMMKLLDYNDLQVSQCAMDVIGDSYYNDDHPSYDTVAHFLVAALKDTNELVRQCALKALSGMGWDASKQLIPALDDTDKNQRLSAAIALCRSPHFYIDAYKRCFLIVMKECADTSIRAKLVENMYREKDPNVITMLIIALDDKDSSICAKAIKALSIAGDTTALPALRHKLNDKKQRWNAAVACALLGYSGVTGLLLEGLHDARQNEALRGLCALKDRRAILPLIKIFNRHDFSCRWAFNLLSEFKDPLLIKPFINLCHDENLPSVYNPYENNSDTSELIQDDLEASRFVENVASALDTMYYPETFALWLSLLNNPQSFGRVWATRMLGRMVDKRAVLPLISALNDVQPDVRKGAALALGAMDDHRCVQPLIRMLKDKEPKVRMAAMISLGATGDTSVIMPLIRMLKDSDERVSNKAVQILGTFRDLRAVVPSINILNVHAISLPDQNSLFNFWKNECDELWFWPFDTSFQSDHTQKAVTAKQMAIKPLLQVLKDGAIPEARIQAAGALGMIGDTCAVVPLIGCLNDSNMDFRIQCAWALGNLHDTRAAEPLMRLLNDSSSFVRAQAAWALGSLKEKRAIDPLITLKNIINVPFKSSNNYPGHIVTKRQLDNEVKIVACALDEIVDTDEVAPLLSLPPWRLNKEIARTLSRLGDRRAMEPVYSEFLQHVLQEIQKKGLNPDKIDTGLIEALGTFNFQRVRKSIHELFEKSVETNECPANYIIDALGDLKDTGAVQSLTRLMASSDPNRYLNATDSSLFHIAKALQKIGVLLDTTTADQCALLLDDSTRIRTAWSRIQRQILRNKGRRELLGFELIALARYGGSSIWPVIADYFREDHFNQSLYTYVSQSNSAYLRHAGHIGIIWMQRIPILYDENCGYSRYIHGEAPIE
jgi:HEAT repeat protein